MGERIHTTGIKPGQITGKEVTIEAGIEALCLVVDHEVVPAVHDICKIQKSHAVDILSLKNADTNQRVDIATLIERSGWNKAVILLGLGSVVTAVFTLIVAVIIPAFR